jgi:hypothetical protein
MMPAEPKSDVCNEVQCLNVGPGSAGGIEHAQRLPDHLQLASVSAMEENAHPKTDEVANDR